ncbi:MAG: 3-methyl-2-oxobutanoate hydroxymethyltransferase [Rhodospirillaceae bacterium]|nr:3-methyl-2-oxobutanoate hydroxymethyltransferase [Rhodospirillaceae bacterium]
MSTLPPPPRRSGGTPISSRLSPRDLSSRKGGQPIVCITAYTAPMARFMDAHVDLLLVGDTMGMVLYGMDTTLGVTLDMTINHTKAVMRGSAKACVIADMPFGTYQASPAEAFKACARVMAETSCAGVKLEGGAEMAETIEFLVDRGIPVLAHIGLKPQSVNVVGGFRVQGRGRAAARGVMADAKAVAAAGAFAVVIEGVVEPVARAVTEAISIPTIGIGASAACDGQIIVAEDILGLFGSFTPKFVKRYAELGQAVSRAVGAYASDVRARRFPGPEHVYARNPAQAKGSQAKRARRRRT